MYSPRWTIAVAINASTVSRYIQRFSSTATRRIQRTRHRKGFAVVEINPDAVAQTTTDHNEKALDGSDRADPDVAPEHPVLPHPAGEKNL